jgi:surface antigen
MSYKYKPRLKAPLRTNKNWIQVSFGGKNKCIPVDGNSVLPNCVGYAWGRFMEILGRQPKLSLGNAELWYGHRSDGYKRGKTPRLGAVICWRKGVVGDPSDGAGHVAIVEKINDDGTLVISESGYKKFRFRTSTIPADFSLEGYVFQGFIYNPKVPAKKNVIRKTPEEIAKEVIKGLWGNGVTRKQRLEEAGYDYLEIQTLVNDLLRNGD